ncbi:hypothetical protein M9Y10_003916 [Tritrichomonas musculus]|uniref:Glycosyl hydrolase family 13 catalytic domain-containing protein n=1 Tax=Tritrichomonas musculus TaxID=1915356 RepID=A0ABR2JQY1_9EUKA
MAEHILPPTSTYEISTRPYLFLLSQKLKKQCKIRDIPAEEFDDWKNKGFNYVWFMGIWEVGPNSISIAKKHEGCIQGYNENLPGWTNDDIIGSPYCIVQYHVNSDIGTVDDIKWVREELKKREMKLIVDFVPNHTAFEAPEIEEHRNFYVWTRTPLQDTDRYAPNGIAYGKELESSSWTDCAQQNYFDLEFRQHQIKILKFIASIADGVRCDMSHCVLNDVFEQCWKNELQALGYERPSTEFWEDATKAVKADYPNFIFLAESYHNNEGKLIQCGFDYAYDKIPYDQLVYNNVGEFTQQIWNRSREYKSHGCFFTENHDEKRAVAVFGTYQRANAAAALLLTLPGMRFFNMNQWEGPRNKIDTHLRRALPEEPIPECIHFYDKLFEILKLDCMRKGEFVQYNIDGSGTIPVWTYTYNNEHIIVTVNFSDNCSGGFIKLNNLPNQEKVDFIEMFSGKIFTYNLSEIKEKGFFVLLDPYQAQIFKY